MKITMVALFAYKIFDEEEPRQFGGAELQLVMLSRELAKNYGVQVQLITRGRGAFRYFQAEGLHVYKLPYYKTYFKRSLFGLWDIYRMLMKLETEVYIQRGGGVETGITGWVAGRKKVPFLFMSAHVWDIDGTRASKEGLLMGNSYFYGLTRATHITTQSQQQRETLLRVYGRESSVFPSAHWIPEAIPGDKQGVLWVGRCEPWKNPEVFLRVAKAMPEYTFTMICPVTSTFDLYERLAHEAESMSNLTFRSSVPYEETESLFASHRLFVNTSEQEGFPNTFVQAAKWGTPIVSLNVNPDDMLNRYEMGSFAGGLEEALVEQTRELLEDQARWSRYSQNAYHYAVQHHDIRKISEDFYRLLESLRKGQSL